MKNEDISFQYACNMCIIQIGELANRLSDEVKETNKDIPMLKETLKKLLL